MKRGTNVFDWQQLHRQVEQLQVTQWLPNDAIRQYQQFYGFTHLLADVRQQVTVIEAAGERIAVHIFHPAPDLITNRCALLCHGYYDHVGLYGYPLQYLLRKGMTVVAFDQIGHGLSSGAPAVIDNFDRYVEVCVEVFRYAGATLSAQRDMRWHWFGQSMGGSVVLETLQQHPDLPHEEVVLFAPLVRPYGWWLSRWLFALAKLTVETRPRHITENADNPEFINLQHADPLQPTVLPVVWVQAMQCWFERFERYPVSNLAPKIIQGHADKTVSWRHNIGLLKERYPGSQWCILPRAGHHLANESGELRGQIYAWLDNNCHW